VGACQEAVGEEEHEGDQHGARRQPHGKVRRLAPSRERMAGAEQEKGEAGWWRPAAVSSTCWRRPQAGSTHESA